LLLLRPLQLVRLCLFSDPPPTETYPLSLHDALPICDDLAGVAAILEAARALLAGAPTANPVVLLFTDGEEAGLLGARAFLGHPLDRKSTRLNSSHVKISYAVFCLKKKKTTNNEHRLL